MPPVGFNPRSQRHRVGRLVGCTSWTYNDFVSIRVHSGIGLEVPLSWWGKWDDLKVSIRVHSGIGLEEAATC